MNLIPRFYDVTDGKITIDGKDIRNVSQHELGRNWDMYRRKLYYSQAILLQISYMVIRMEVKPR